MIEFKELLKSRISDERMIEIKEKYEMAKKTSRLKRDILIEILTR